eukprot:g17172.t1
MTLQDQRRRVIKAGLLPTMFSARSVAAEINLPAGSPAATSRRLQTSDATSLGCYADSGTDRVLELALLNSAVMTPDFCAAFCLDKGSYLYFAVQYGEECWCGAEGVDYARLGAATTCNTVCTGDITIDCGGDFAFEIFEYDLVAESLGCWADDKIDRVFATPHTTSDTNTPEECQASCVAAGGFEYFGVQYAEECFCGLGTEDYTVLGASTDCTSECTGDSSTYCGGRNAIEVFSIGGYLGCWADDSVRVFSAPFTSTSDNTPESCQATCSGYEYFGLQYGKECFCGEADEDHTVYGASTGCTLACSGEYFLSTCGGHYAMDVFSVADYEPEKVPSVPVTPAPTTALSPPTPAPISPPPVDSTEDCLVVIIEAEDIPLVGDWSVKSDSAASGGQYIVWEGLEPEANNQDPDDIITVIVRVPSAGMYQVKWKMRQPHGVASDRANDSWLYFPTPPADRFGPLTNSRSYGDFIKVYGRAMDGVFEYSGTGEEDDNSKSRVGVEFAAAGEYEMQIAGRSHGHEIDQIVLFDDSLEGEDVDDAIAAGGSC